MPWVCTFMCSSAVPVCALMCTLVCIFVVYMYTCAHCAQACVCVCILCLCTPVLVYGYAHVHGYPGCSCLNVCVSFVHMYVCVCVCKEALVCLFCVCTWPCGVHPVCLCRGSTCGLRMLILPGSCVEVVGAAERERPVMGGRRALLAEARAPPTRLPLFLAPSLRGEFRSPRRCSGNWRSL